MYNHILHISRILAIQYIQRIFHIFIIIYSFCLTQAVSEE
jgi:hypothetical protein